jgi:hypothetical protein
MAKRKKVRSPADLEWFALRIKTRRGMFSFLAYGTHGGPAVFNTIKNAREFARELAANRGPTSEIVRVKLVVTTD